MNYPMKWHARANGAIVGTLFAKPQDSYWNPNDDNSWIVLNAPSKEEAEKILYQTKWGLICNQIEVIYHETDGD